MVVDNILNIKKIQQNIKILNKTNKVLYLFTNNLLSINNLIINYLNIQDLTPKYENLEDSKIDFFTLNKALNLKLLNLELFDILPNTYMCMPEYDYDNSIKINPQILEILDRATNHLGNIKLLLPYLIEDKNFYYKYIMSKSLLNNLELYVGLVDLMKYNSKQILDYYTELLKMENSISFVYSVDSLNALNALNALNLNALNVLNLNLKIKKVLYDKLGDKLGDILYYFNGLNNLKISEKLLNLLASASSLSFIQKTMRIFKKFLKIIKLI